MFYPEHQKNDVLVDEAYNMFAVKAIFQLES